MRPARLAGLAVVALIVGVLSAFTLGEDLARPAIEISVVNDSVVFEISVAHSKVSATTLAKVDSMQFRIDRMFVGSPTDAKFATVAKSSGDTTSARLAYPLSGIWNPNTTVSGRYGVAFGRIHPEGASAGLWSATTFEPWSYTRDLSPPPAPDTASIGLVPLHLN